MEHATAAAANQQENPMQTAIDRSPAAAAELEPAAAARVESAVRSSKSANTRRTYRAQWARFAGWAAANAHATMPAAPAAVAAYLAEAGETRKVATVRLAAAAIGAAHRAAGQPDPTAAAVVRETLRGIARQQAANPAAAVKQATAIDLETAVRMMALAPTPQPAGRGYETPAAAAARGRLDAAIVALLFCAGMRRSEVAALVWRDVQPAAQPGRLNVQVRASKANPDGGRPDHRLLVNGFAAAVETLRASVQPGELDRVVPLSPQQVNRRVQRLARLAGVDGVSAHSGRRGLACELVRRGASTTSVQAAGGWRDPQMVARYASAVAVEDGAVARFLA